MNVEEIDIGELRGTVNSHIQQCGDFKKAMWTIFALAITINAAAFGYLVRVMDNIRDTQSEIRNSQSILERTTIADRDNVTARLSTIVNASLQRELGLTERIKNVEIGVYELRKELKEDMKRDRERR